MEDVTENVTLEHSQMFCVTEKSTDTGISERGAFALKKRANAKF